MPAAKGEKSSSIAFSVDVSPDASALKMFKSMSFTPWYALGEFVDNSITSAQRDVKKLKAIYGKDYRLLIDIDIDQASGVITISDNAGGIARTDMQRALRTGHPPADTSTGLSKHGVGLKAASFWWGSSVQIETWPIGEETGWRLGVDITNDITPLVAVEPIPREIPSGTKITIQNLWQKIPQTSTIRKIESYLPSIYRMYISDNYSNAPIQCTIRYCGKVLEYTAPELLTAPYWPNAEGPDAQAVERLWRLPAEISLSSGKQIKGWVGILSSLSRDLSGFFLHFRGKGIAGVVPADDGDGNSDASGAAAGAYKPKSIFGQGGSYQDQSYVGEFDLSDFGKTITTDAPLWSIEEEAEFVRAVEKLLDSPPESFSKMVLNYKRRKVSRREQEKQQKWDELESKRIQDALDMMPSHSVSISKDDAAHTPNFSSDGGKIAFDIRDKEGHTHSFKLQWVIGRSEPFMTILEDEHARVHTVYVNREHPALDNIQYTAEVRNSLQRVCVALAAAEVFLPGYERSQVRMKLNELLGELHE